MSNSRQQFVNKPKKFLKVSVQIVRKFHEFTFQLLKLYEKGVSTIEIFFNCPLSWLPSGKRY